MELTVDEINHNYAKKAYIVHKTLDYHMNTKGLASHVDTFYLNEKIDSQ